MDEFEIASAKGEPTNTLAVTPALRAMCPKNKASLLDNIMMDTFESWAYVYTGGYTSTLALGLRKETKDGRNDPFSRQGQRTITIWFYPSCHLIKSSRVSCSLFNGLLRTIVSHMPNTTTRRAFSTQTRQGFRHRRDRQRMQN